MKGRRRFGSEMLVLVLGLLAADGCGQSAAPESSSAGGGGASFTTGTGLGGGAGQSTTAGSGGAVSMAGAQSAGAPTASAGAEAVQSGGGAVSAGGAAGTSASGSDNSGSGGDLGSNGGVGGALSMGGTGGCAGLFCEDFESGTLDASVWNTQANHGQTVKVQTGTVAHGKYAVQFHALPNVVSYDFIITKQAPAALKGHHYGRSYFYVTPKPPAEHTEFIFAGTSGFPMLKYLEVAESGLGWQLTFVQLVSPTGETYKPATGKVPLAKWACLQWEMNDTPDQISVSVDGTQQVSFDDIGFMGKNTGLVGGFTDFGFGLYIWHPATYAFDVFYDDIVLDTKPVPCLAQ